MIAMMMSARISSHIQVLIPPDSGSGVGGVTAGTTVSRTLDLALSLVITGTPTGEFHSVVPSQTEPRTTYVALGVIVLGSYGTE